MNSETLDTIDSTSLEAARRAANGERGPLWLRAVRQTAGRGRSGRDWDSPEGNLHATLLMPVADDPARSALHSFVACLAVADTLDFLSGAPARIALKWPNDVLLDGCKVAGVLLESGLTSTGRWLSIGIGINLAHAPAETRWPAISVAGATGRAAPAPGATLDILAPAMQARIAQFTAGGFPSIRTDWLARAARLGEIVEARLPTETVRGRFETLDDDGAMLLQTGTGTRRIHAADVHFPGEADASGH